MTKKKTTRKEIIAYIDNAIDSFRKDPADTRFQEGYLSALQTMKDDLDL